MSDDCKMEEAFNENFIAVKSGDRMHKSKVFKAFYLKGITENEDIIEFLETKDIELNKKLSEFGSKQKGVFIGIKCKPRKKKVTPTNAHSEQPEPPAPLARMKMKMLRRMCRRMCRMWRSSF